MQVDKELMNIFDIVNCSKGPYLLKGICKTNTLVKRYNILIPHNEIRNKKMRMYEVIY